jgi:putative acetyltransferase
MTEQSSTVFIRPESDDDYSAVYQVNLVAFGRPNEARLVNNLRHLPGTISLVASLGDQVVGHIFFCPVAVDGSGALICALAPMAVIPAHQGQGIGSNLVQAGLQACQAWGYELVVVLGHTWFYPRFGFRPASPFGIHFPTPVPDEAFMVLELVPGRLAACSGTVRYPAEFQDVD